jgi:hypothetical protein
MEKPDAIADIVGLNKYAPLVDCEQTRKVYKSLQSIINTIVKLTSELDSSYKEFDMLEIDNLVDDLQWGVKDIEVAMEVLVDYEDAVDAVERREAEIISRLSDDEQEEFDQQMVVYKLTVGK